MIGSHPENKGMKAGRHQGRRDRQNRDRMQMVQGQGQVKGGLLQNQACLRGRRRELSPVTAQALGRKLPVLGANST